MKNDLLQTARNLYPDQFRKMAADRTWMIEEFRWLVAQFRKYHAETREDEKTLQCKALSPIRRKALVEQIAVWKTERKLILELMTDIRRSVRETDRHLFGSAPDGRRGPAATA
jgi:hypothetical protein